MEIHENDPKLSSPVGKFPAQNRLVRSSSFLAEPEASLPGFRADATILNS